MMEPQLVPAPAAAAERATRDPMIEVRGLDVLRDRREVCRGIDLDVPRGGCAGVIGPNGSGKTSLLLGMRGLLPHRGVLRLAGQDAGRLARRDLARLVAVVPQRMEFAFPYTVEEMALLGRTPHRRPWQAFGRHDRRIVAELLERLGIADLARERVDAISGGERRKVFLARALAQETPILFLDEPTAGLDPRAQEELADLLSELRREAGKTVVVVLHDLRLIHRLCDDIVGLRDGTCLCIGPPSDVLTPRLLERLFDVGWEEYERPGRPPLFAPRREAPEEDAR